MSSSSFEAQQGLRELCHERDHLKELRADLAGVQCLVQAASQLQAGGVRLAEVVYTSAEAASSRARAVAHACDELHEEYRTLAHTRQQEERDSALQQEVADTQHAEALKLLGTYGDRLGLAISRVAPNTLRMAFTCIDKNNPDGEFYFTLGLASLEQGMPGTPKEEAYCVCECVPQVLELPKLLAELNAEASCATALPRFVCCMRRSFISLASPA